MPSRRDIRSDEQLQIVAEHVRYEMKMLVYTAERLPPYHASPRGIGENEKNVLLESFLLHFRNLHAFLCPGKHRPPKRDDVIASDFLKKAEATDCAALSGFTDDDQERLNKMLAHISDRRPAYISDGDDGWHVAPMLTMMLKELDVFFEKCPRDQREWFPSAEWMRNAIATAAKDPRSQYAVDEPEVYRTQSGS
jgi:hypothetical protein